MDIYDNCCPNDIITCHQNSIIKCRGNPSVAATTTTTSTATATTVATTTTSASTTTAAVLTTTTITTCQPPPGYTYKTSVDKYYKPVKDSVTWQTAKDACSSEGSMLVELKTLAEYQAIRPLFGMCFNNNDFN